VDGSAVTSFTDVTATDAALMAAIEKREFPTLVIEGRVAIKSEPWLPLLMETWVLLTLVGVRRQRLTRGAFLVCVCVLQSPCPWRLRPTSAPSSFTRAVC
jgi:hypothetical protein